MVKFEGKEFKLERIDIPDECGICEHDIKDHCNIAYMITFEDGSEKWVCKNCGEKVEKEQKGGSKKYREVEKFLSPTSCECGAIGHWGIWTFGNRKPYILTIDGEEKHLCPRCGEEIERLGLVEAVE